MGDVRIGEITKTECDKKLHHRRKPVMEFSVYINYQCLLRSKQIDSLFDKLEFDYFTTTSTAVHLPLLQELSETLQVAIPRVTSANTSRTILSFDFDNGVQTSILPSVLIFVFIKRFIGRIIGCFIPSAPLMLSRQFGWSFPLW